MHLDSRYLALFTCVVVGVGCGDDSGGSGGGSCVDLQACGGDPTGRWEVVSACGVGLEAEAAMGFGVPACLHAVQRVEPTITGTYEFGSSREGVGDTVTQMDIDMLFSAECISGLLGAPVGPAEVLMRCADLEDQYAQSPDFVAVACHVEGSACACALTSAEEHLVETLSIEGTNFDDGSELSAYCVQGDTLVVQDGPAADRFVRVEFRRVRP